MKNCTPLWREARVQVKMYKTHQVRTTFGSWDVEKVHAVVARSTSPSQKYQKLSGSEHFWKLWCRKSVRRCGVKRISKSKCTKHTTFSTPLDVERLKKRTPLRRKAHFHVKCVKNYGGRTTFWRSDVEKVHAVAARSTFPSEHCQKLWGSDLFWTVRCRFCLARARDSAPCEKRAKREVCSSLNYQLQRPTLDYTRLYYSTLRYTTLHSTTLHYTTLHYITLLYATLQYIQLHYTYN